MPQRPTTHKDLHRAAIGSAFSLVYLLAMPGVWAQNAPHAASAGLSTKTEQARLVKNEQTKPAATSPAKVVIPAKTISLTQSAPSTKSTAPVKTVIAPLKPLGSPAAVIAVPDAKSPTAKGGKLREIPLSTLDGDKTLSTSKSVKVDPKPDGKSSAKTDSVKPKRTTASARRLNNGLVPPPPPIMPIGMDVLGMYAQPVDYLSMKDLEARKKELSVRFNELESIVSDGQRQIKERKERAELFESLYQEGVVSRKELEVAKREAGEIDRDFKFKQDELDSVKVSMKAVNNRLAVLKKTEAKMNPSKQKTKKAVVAGRIKSTEKRK